jgi:hypothetical protein
VLVRKNLRLTVQDKKFVQSKNSFKNMRKYEEIVVKISAQSKYYSVLINGLAMKP